MRIRSPIFVSGTCKRTYLLHVETCALSVCGMCKVFSRVFKADQADVQSESVKGANHVIHMW